VVYAMHPIVSAFIRHAGNVFVREGGILKRFNLLKVTFTGSFFLSNSLYSWLHLQATIIFMAVERTPTNITKNILTEPCSPSDSEALVSSLHSEILERTGKGGTLILNSLFRKI